MNRVLIIEDAEDIAKLVQLHLRDIECDVDIAADGREGLKQFQSHHYDLVILDIMLPGMDGLDVCRALRAGSHYVAILMLTAKSTEMDRVLGLEMGADDYLTKPFSIPELLARVKALFRRAKALEARQLQTHLDAKVTIGQLKIDVDKREVSVANKRIELTAKEFQLLLFFARHPGTVFTRTQLLEHVWNYHYSGYEHTVNSHINRLRAKVESDPANPKYILTVWGVGYKFSDRQCH
ncbi:MAG TPA: DNA-binding response regulator [Gammaproteobacteria bacterium]|nr:DNA-binding response regulator [Gammaproteobacteria bacterium]